MAFAVRKLCLLAAAVLPAVVARCAGDGQGLHIHAGVADPAFADVGHSVRSPSGAYTLTVLPTGRQSGVPTVTIRVLDRRGRPVYTDPARYSTDATTLPLWADRADQAWVCSGDVGTFLAASQPGGGWVKSAWVDLGRPRAPAALRRARPRFFPT